MNQTAQHTPERKQALLRTKDACTYLGIGRTKLHYLHETDPTFPRKIRISPRCVGYLKESLDAWLTALEKGGRHA